MKLLCCESAALRCWNGFLQVSGGYSHRYFKNIDHDPCCHILPRTLALVQESLASTHISSLLSDSTRLKARLNCSVCKPRAYKCVKSLENIHISIQNSAAAVTKVSGNWWWRLPHALSGIWPSRVCKLEIPRF